MTVQFVSNRFGLMFHQIGLTVNDVDAAPERLLLGKCISFSVVSSRESSGAKAPRSSPMGAVSVSIVRAAARAGDV